MEDNNFKIGDVVFLNSGSPQMTINQLTETHATVIFWNTDLFKFEEGVFLIETISLVMY